MKLKANRDVRIRFEDGMKRDVKAGQVVELKYYDTVQYFLKNGFSVIETKDMEDKETPKVQKQVKKKATPKKSNS